jgi:hypothetical protein
VPPYHAIALPRFSHRVCVLAIIPDLLPKQCGVFLLSALFEVENSRRMCSPGVVLASSKATACMAVWRSSGRQHCSMRKAGRM